MTERLIVPTEREDVDLRQLSNLEDDLAYFQAVDANREHLSQFGDVTAKKYQTIEDVTKARQNAGNILRMGIWNSEAFVGFMKATPHDDDEAEIGYWVDGRYVGNGFATVATRALASHLSPDYERIYAEVVIGNEASAHVLTSAGFEKTDARGNRIIFELPK